MRWFLLVASLLVAGAGVPLARAEALDAGAAEVHGRRKKSKRPKKPPKKRGKAKDKADEGEHPKPPAHKGISF